MIIHSLVADLLAHDPGTNAASLRAVTNAADTLPATVRHALAVHPHLPEDVTLQSLIGPGDGQLVADLLSDQRLPAGLRAQAFTDLNSVTLWEALELGLPVTADEIRLAHPKRVTSGRNPTRQTLLLLDNTPLDLATAAAAEVAAHPDIDVTATATLLAHAALRHCVDLTKLPTIAAPLRALLFEHTDDHARYQALSARLAGFPLDSTPMLAMLGMSDDAHFAQAAVDDPNASIQGRHNPVIANGRMSDDVRLASCFALARDASPATYAKGTFLIGVDHIERFAATTTSATTLLALATTLLSKRPARGRQRILAENVLAAAVTNPHLLTEHSEAMYEQLREVNSVPVLAAFAATPTTASHVRATALEGPLRGSQSYVTDIARALHSGHPSPAGHLKVRDLNKGDAQAHAARAAAHLTATTHPAWAPDNAEMTRALLTLEHSNDLTLLELLETAHALTA